MLHFEPFYTPVHDELLNILIGLIDDDRTNYRYAIPEICQDSRVDVGSSDTLLMKLSSSF